jgi:hypothetical protein
MPQIRFGVGVEFRTTDVQSFLNRFENCLNGGGNMYEDKTNLAWQSAWTTQTRPSEENNRIPLCNLLH